MLSFIYVRIFRLWDKFHLNFILMSESGAYGPEITQAEAISVIWLKINYVKDNYLVIYEPECLCLLCVIICKIIVFYISRYLNYKIIKLRRFRSCNIHPSSGRKMWNRTGEATQPGRTFCIFLPLTRTSEDGE